MALRDLREQNTLRKIEKLPHERIVDAYLDPAGNRGAIEKILMNAWK